MEILYINVIYKYHINVYAVRPGGIPAGRRTVNRKARRADIVGVNNK